MSSREFIARSLDTTNGLTLANGVSEGINPAMFDFKVREFEQEKLIFANLAEYFDMTAPGASLTVTIDQVPTAAVATADTDNANVSAFSTRQVTFNPIEYTEGRQVTRAEMNTTFFPAMERASRGIGYALGIAKERAAYSAILSGAGNSVIVNGVSATTDLASTDTLNYEAINEALTENEDDLYTDGQYLIVNYKQRQALRNLGHFFRANEFGNRDVIEKGLVGEILGLKVYATSEVTTSSNVAAAVLMSKSGSGDSPLGYALKEEATIDQDYEVLGRYYNVVGTEMFDFKVLHPNGICLIYSYA